MAKKTLAGLQREIERLEEIIGTMDQFRREVNLALDIYHGETKDVALKTIQKLMQDKQNSYVDQREENVSEMTRLHTEHRLIEMENQKLWFLLRSLMKDETLKVEYTPEELAKINLNTPSVDHYGFEQTPFKKPRF